MSISSEQLLTLSRQFATPLYVYDGDTIAQRYREIFEHVTYPKLKLLYAMKANYNVAVLSLMKELGACIDAVSPGDVEMARRVGFSVDDILYTANNLTDAEMAEVGATGVLFNIGSLSELDRYGRLFPGRNVCLRFNPMVVAGAHAKIQTGGDLTKFGILLDDVDAAVSLAQKHSLSIVGIHKHTGSGIKEEEKFLQAVHNLLAIVTPTRFPDLTFVDFGGGLYVPYSPTDPRIDYAQFGKKITQLVTTFSRAFGKEVSLWFEPGKYLVAESGHLLVEVNTLKNNHGRVIAGTNSGFPQLIRPVFYDAYHHIVNLTNPTGPPGTYDICGNICETGDQFAKERLLPQVREGDILDIQNAGAYCYAMGGVYNLRSMPAEVFVRNGKSSLVRRRLSSKELIDQIMAECPGSCA